MCFGSQGWKGTGARAVGILKHSGSGRAIGKAVGSECGSSIWAQRKVLRRARSGFECSSRSGEGIAAHCVLRITASMCMKPRERVCV